MDKVMPINTLCIDRNGRADKSNGPAAGAALYALPGKVNISRSEWLPLWVHLSDTAGIMKKLLTEWVSPSCIKILTCSCDEETLISTCIFLALTHDIGKMTPAMARKMLGPGTEKVEDRLNTAGLTVPAEAEINSKASPHALAGQVILLREGIPDPAAVIVGSHHGKPDSMNGSSEYQMINYHVNYFGTDDTQADIWQSIWSQWTRHSLRKAGFRHTSEIYAATRSEQVILTGLLIIADWIASNERYFPLIPFDDDGSRISLKERIERGWKEASFTSPWKPARADMNDDDFKDTFGFRPNALQKTAIRAMKECKRPGLTIIEAPMGRGKSEGALALAEIIAAKTGCGGIFFGLPTQATANGIFSRFEAWAKTQSEDVLHSIRLAHALAELNDDYISLLCGTPDDKDGEESGLIVHEWFSGRKQALLPEFVIGTIDHVLMAALKQKHVMLRHLGLCGKVVILDEVHSYDTYMSQYLDRALEWLGRYGTPVILLSATLTKERKADLLAAYTGKRAEDINTGSAYPLVTWTDEKGIHEKAYRDDGRPKTVNIRKMSDKETAKFLRDALSEGGCAGIIVNTVTRAQSVAGYLRKELPDKKVVLIHSRFTESDRAERERTVMEKIGKNSASKDRDGVIVVGTQVLEQSLDIDFDILLTDICPMDLLMQRMGRLHRHDRQRPDKLSEPACMIFTADRQAELSSAFIYEQWTLSQTAELLPDSVTLPDMIPGLIEAAYRAPGEDDGSRGYRLWKEYKNNKAEKKGKADVYRLIPPEKAGSRRAYSMRGMLDTDAPDDGRTDAEKEAGIRALVRDCSPSLEVMTMVKGKDGKICFFPWQHNSIAIGAEKTLDAAECRLISKQRIRLPETLCSAQMLEETLKVLERQNADIPQALRDSPLLKRERFLFINESGTLQIGKYRLRYDKDDGLICFLQNTGEKGEEV